MKSIYDLNKEDRKRFSKIKLIVLDTDGVIVPFGTKITEKKDTVCMKLKHPPKRFYDLIKKLVKKYKILISSGRSMLTLRSMYSDIVTEGVYLQCENGVRTFSFSDSFTSFSFNSKYYLKLHKILSEIRKIRERGVAIEPKEHILSIHSKKEHEKVYKIVKRFDKEKELYVLWNGEAFDIGSKKVTKGTGLKKFMQRYNLRKENVLCVGDKENDLPLFKECGVSISVSKGLKADYYLPVKKELPGIDLMKFLSQIK